MTIAPGSHHAGAHARPSEHTAFARASVLLAAAATGAVVAAGILYGSAVAIGGTTATEDNWVGLLTVVLMAAGVLSSLAGFVLAVTVRVRHEHRPLLWLPLTVLPALIAFLVLGEAFWWE